MSAMHQHRVSVPLLLLCSKALQEVMQFTHPADATLSRFFRQHAQVLTGIAITASAVMTLFVACVKF